MIIEFFLLLRIFIFSKRASFSQLTPAFSLFLAGVRHPQSITAVTGAGTEFWEVNNWSPEREGLFGLVMGNCNACIRAGTVDDKSNHSKNENNKRKKKKKNNNDKKNRERRPNPYSEDPIRSPAPIRVLKDVIPLSHRTRIGDKYILGRELGRGEFGITYLCTDREDKQTLACKSISKRKLRTAVIDHSSK